MTRKTTIGENIKTLREMRGLSQSDLAEIVGVKPAAISKYEQGRVPNIPPKRIEQIAKALGVTPNVLIGWDESSSTKSTVPNAVQVSSSGLTDAEKEILEKFRQIDDEHLPQAMAYLQFLISLRNDK